MREQGHEFINLSVYRTPKLYLYAVGKSLISYSIWHYS